MVRLLQAELRAVCSNGIAPFIKIMATVKENLRNAAFVAASMFGRFGDVEKPDDTHKAIIAGSHKFAGESNNWKGRKSGYTRQSQRARSGHGKGHRRTYLSGKAWAR